MGTFAGPTRTRQLTHVLPQTVLLRVRRDDMNTTLAIRPKRRILQYVGRGIKYYVSGVLDLREDLNPHFQFDV